MFNQKTDALQCSNLQKCYVSGTNPLRNLIIRKVQAFRFCHCDIGFFCFFASTHVSGNKLLTMLSMAVEASQRDSLSLF